MSEVRRLWYLNRRRENKLKAVEYLGGKCKKCGYCKCIQALDFNHLRDKKKRLSKLFQRSWKVIKNELDKCELLCANCHREYTFKN